MPASDSQEYSDTLYDLVYSCRRGQRVTIVGGLLDQDSLREGLYVEQEEDEEVEEFFREADQDDGRLLILTGSAGDGKSALLERAYQSHPDALKEGHINLDATEARRRTEGYQQRLDDFFEGIINNVTEGDGERSAVAMNYGLAVNYFEGGKFPEEFEPIWNEMRKSRSKPRHDSSSPNVSVINLSHRRTYSVNPDELGEGLLRDITLKFDPENEDSPFATAWKHELQNCPAGDDCILQYNLRQFTNPNVRRRVAEILAGWSVVTTSYLNPRAIIDMIASAVLPTGLQELPDHDACPVGYATTEEKFEASADEILWNTLFRKIGAEHPSGPHILDPTSFTTFDEDYRLLQLGNQLDEVTEEIADIPANLTESKVALIQTAYRQSYFRGKEARTILQEDEFREYAAAVYFFRRHHDDPEPGEEIRKLATNFTQNVKSALNNWTGQQRTGELVEFVDGYRSTEYTFLSKWQEPEFNREKIETESTKLAVPGKLTLVANAPEGGSEDIHLPLSFETYLLMTMVGRGYTPNATDLNRSHAIQLLNSRLDQFTKKNNDVYIDVHDGARRIRLERGPIQLNVTLEESA